MSGCCGSCGGEAPNHTSEQEQDKPVEENKESSQESEKKQEEQ